MGGFRTVLVSSLPIWCIELQKLLNQPKEKPRMLKPFLVYGGDYEIILTF